MTWLYIYIIPYIVQNDHHNNYLCKTGYKGGGAETADYSEVYASSYYLSLRNTDYKYISYHTRLPKCLKCAHLPQIYCILWGGGRVQGSCPRYGRTSGQGTMAIPLPNTHLLYPPGVQCLGQTI